MTIKNLSFHEICDLIKEEPSKQQMNSIINQMIPNVRFEDYDKIDERNMRDEYNRFTRKRKKIYETENVLIKRTA